MVEITAAANNRFPKMLPKRRTFGKRNVGCDHKTPEPKGYEKDERQKESAIRREGTFD